MRQSIEHFPFGLLLLLIFFIIFIGNRHSKLQKIMTLSQQIDTLSS
jgi:hypothetical protein